MKRAGKVRNPYRVHPPSRIFNRFLRIVLEPVLWWKYRIRIEKKEIRGLKAPFLVISNHDMSMDPFIVCIGFPDPPYIVSSEHLFRIPFLGFLMRTLVAGIPKTKGRADTAAIRTMVEARDRGYPILVFPETGGRNWGGQTSPVIPATAKLVRFLKIPVVAAIFEGAYLTTPRWAFHPRRGHVTVRYHVALTAEEASTLKDPEILARLQAAIDWDDNLWQKSNLERGAGVRYRGRHRAEGIERALYLCPSCGTIGGIRSAGDSFRCGRCGYGATIDEYGLFDGTTAMRDDCAAVERILARKAAEHLARPDAGPFLRARMRIWSSPVQKPMKEIGRGELRLDRTDLTFETAAGPVSIPIEDIKAVTCLMANLLEFRAGERVYRVVFDDRMASIRLWQTAVRIFADHAAGGDSGVVEE